MLKKLTGLFLITMMVSCSNIISNIPKENLLPTKDIPIYVIPN